MFTLNPQIHRSSFTVDEDCIVMAAIKKYGTNFRDFPANLLPGRNLRQIRSRYNNVLKFVGKRDHWTQDHDIKLMELVDELGATNWVQIAEKMIYHSRTSCRQRYTTIKKFLNKYPNLTVSDVPRRKRAFSTNVTTDNWMEQMQRNEYDDTDDDANEIVDSKSDSQHLILKKTEKNFYEYFKYSHNFVFGKRVIGGDGLFENVQIACQLMHASHIPMQMDIYNHKFSNYVTMNSITRQYRLQNLVLGQLTELIRNDFRFPVNLSTILGLRGLTIMFDSKTCAKSQSNSKTEEKQPQKQHKAMELFKSRFQSVFKNTAAVAKLNDLQPVRETVRIRGRKRKLPRASAFDNSSKLMRVIPSTEPSTSGENAESNRITVLENISIDLSNTQSTSHQSNQLLEELATTSYEPYNFQYTFDPYKNMYKIDVPMYPSDSEEKFDDQNENSSTQFIVFDPTVIDEDSITDPSSITKIEK